MDHVALRIPDGVDLRLYLHDPGEEIWFHFFWIPESYPSVNFESDITEIEIRVLPEVHVSGGECREDWGRGDYGRKFR